MDGDHSVTLAHSWSCTWNTMHAFLHLPATEPALGFKLGKGRWADVQPVEPWASPPLITNHPLQY